MIELLRTRRSVRRYKPLPLSAAARAILEEAALRSPTSRNREVWEFVFVDDPVLLKGLAAAKPHGGAFVGDAPLAVVVCGDETRSDVWVEDCSIACILLQVTAHDLGLGSGLVGNHIPKAKAGHSPHHRCFPLYLVLGARRQ